MSARTVGKHSGLAEKKVGCRYVIEKRGHGSVQFSDPIIHIEIVAKCTLT